MLRLLNISLLIGLMAGVTQAMAQTPPPLHGQRRPTRSAHARLCHSKRVTRRRQRPGKHRWELYHRPTHTPAPEMSVQDGVPQGAVIEFTMNSTDSRIYPGIAREPALSARQIQPPPSS